MAKITLKGNTIQTVGNLPEVGTVLPEITFVSGELKEQSIADFKGKRKIINIFPSVDTGVCAASVRKFNEEVGALENTVVINLSKDLPFALSRFCAAEGLDHVKSFSAFRDDAGEQLGVTICDGPMRGLLSRAVIVADENNKIIYTQQVGEITEEPNYEAVLSSLK